MHKIAIIGLGPRGISVFDRIIAYARNDASATPLALYLFDGKEFGPGFGTVVATEFLGHDVLLTIDAGGDTPPITVRQHSVEPPAESTKVRIEILGGGLVLR